MLPKVTNPAQLGFAVSGQIFHVMGFFLQFIAPAGFLIGAMVSFFKQSHRRSLFATVSANPKVSVKSLKWLEFERLVGEALRRDGFQVAEQGGAAPDGGVDLVARKDGKRFFVQCKQWRTQQVGVAVVRELHGVVKANWADGGIVVTGGKFTREAREFAELCHMKLIDGEMLEKFIGRVAETSPPTATTVTAPSAPVCPRCGAEMVERNAKQGKFAGQRFWGCTTYPKCSGIRQIS